MLSNEDLENIAMGDQQYSRDSVKLLALLILEIREVKRLLGELVEGQNEDLWRGH